jgi:transaldolase
MAINRRRASGRLTTCAGNTAMKFFVDTADTAEIADLAATGLLDGVTTNPSLIAKSGRDFIEVTKEICGLTHGPVSAEVVALDHEGMMREAEILRKIADNVCIKVPLTIDGLKTCKKLTADGTMVNVTLCFSANQALLAAKAGATFISPFVGRHDDNGFDGMDLIRDIRLIYDNYASRPKSSSPRSATASMCWKAPDRRRRDHRAARGDQGPVQACPDRQGHRRLPCGLGQDRPIYRVTR